MVHEITSLGTYFAFQMHEAKSLPEAPWRPISDLLDGSEALASRYEKFQHILEAGSDGPVDFRVAASTGHLALMARLICPAFGAVLLGDGMDLSKAWWQPVISGVMPLSVPNNAIGPSDDISSLLTGPVRTLTDLTAGMSVSPKVLWGNVSSAVNGAVMAACDARPELAARAMALGHTFGRALGTAPGPGFRRDSCCLIYRIAPPGEAVYCNDCVLTPAGRPPIRTASR